MIEQMGNWANQIFWVVFILGLCIFSHELGHFIAAKLSRMQVNEFAFGFGPLIRGLRWGETTYAIRAIPFGGQVNIAGMEPGEEDVPRGFHTRPRWQRFITIFAGVLMNVVLAMVLFWIINVFHGVPIAGTREVIVGKVMSDTPAEAAGLQTGDEIVAVDGNRYGLQVASVEPGSPAAEAGITPGYFILTANGKDIAAPIGLIEVLQQAKTDNIQVGAMDPRADSLPEAIVTAQLPRMPGAGELSPHQATIVAHQRLGLTFEPLDQTALVRYLSLRPGTQVNIMVARDNSEVNLTVSSQAVWGRLETITAAGQLDAPHRRIGRIGVLLTSPTQRVGILKGLVLGARQSYAAVVMVIESVQGMITRKITAEPTGPIGIMAMTAQQAQAGWAAVLSLGGIISANLAVINLIPIPPFDGFHILLIGYEGIIRRRIRPKPETIIRLAGIFLILLLFAWLMAKDVVNLWLYGTP